MTYRTKEQKEQYNKSWSKRNPQKIKEYNEKYKEKYKLWREKNKDKIKLSIRKWYLKNRERQLELRKEWYQIHKKEHGLLGKQRLWNRKITCFIHYSGNPPKCACCKEKGVKFLSIDHINNDGNIQRKKQGHGGGDHTYRWIVKNNFPKGFQVLCYNCNQAKGIYGKCPHKEK